MIAPYFAELTRAVSVPRLARYRSSSGTDLETAVNYLWNMAVAETFCTSLNALEVSLRNSIHDAFTAEYGTEFWFRHPHFRSNRGLNNELVRVESRLGLPTTSGKIVAEIHFFYWTTILSRSFHKSHWNPNKAALLRTVFPYLRGPKFRRDLIYDQYNLIRMFRNRVFHYEPLLYGFALPGQPVVPLEAMHDNIITALGWISPEFQQSVRLVDRFDDVWTNGKMDIEVNLKNYLGDAQP